jgi:antirestriction protein
MADYTPNPWILDEIAANRKWMVEMMDGMPTECLTSCAKEIEYLRAELAKRTDERDEARQKFCEMMSNNSRLEFTTPQWFAEEEGWDCYKDYK